MKVYVDELSKSCESCPFCKIETYVEFVGYTTNSYSCVLDGSMLTNTCPLQPLSEHDKQVCEKVLLIIDEKFNCCGYIEEKFDDIKRYVLDQIQGENNVKD